LKYRQCANTHIAEIVSAEIRLFLTVTLSVRQQRAYAKQSGLTFQSIIPKHMRPGAQTVDIVWRSVLSLVAKNDERSFMSDIYAMQRANGDWFALDDHGRLRVPLFHSSHDAMIARLRNFGLLLFKPVVLDARFLKKIVPLPGEDEVHFCMVDDPFASLNCGSPLWPAQLALLIRRSDEHQNNSRKGNRFHVSGVSALPQSDNKATETWEDEGAPSRTGRGVA